MRTIGGLPPRRGSTLLEVMFSILISSMVIAGTLSIFIVTRSYLEESFYENLLRSRASAFMEKVKGLINSAYQPDTSTPSFVPEVYNNGKRLAFTTPDSDGDGSAESYILAQSNNGTGDSLELTHNGTVYEILGNVSDFRVDIPEVGGNYIPEGTVAMFVTVSYDVLSGSGGGSGRNKHKQFTLMTRAMPRNNGDMDY